MNAQSDITLKMKKNCNLKVFEASPNDRFGYYLVRKEILTPAVFYFFYDSFGNSLSCHASETTNCFEVVCVWLKPTQP